MRKLYGYSGELEKRVDRLDAARSNELVSEMLSEQMGIDESMTFGEMFLKICSYMLDLPEDIWNKHANEIQEEDVKAFLELWERDAVTFVQE